MEVSNEVQRLSHELHSPKLDYLGLAIAMGTFCREFSEQQKINIIFQSRDLPNPVPSDISLALFRVLQEAVHNAAKHSGTKEFDVQLWGVPGEIHFAVRDSGVGFEPEAARRGPGLGLISMQERVQLLQGTLSIESGPNRGTVIHARVPLKREGRTMSAFG